MTRTGAIARPPLEERTESVFEWVQLHVKELAIATIALAAVLVGIWLYRSSQESKGAQAERSLLQAQQSYLTGNLPLAQSDLQKVVTRYDGTSASVQAAMLLAQVLYDQGKFAEGVQALEKVVDDGEAKPFRPAIHALVASGLEDQGKFRDAAKRYHDASEATPFAAEKQLYLAHEARAYQDAGDKTQAIKLWSDLAKDPTSSVAGEARIRLGELTAAPDAA